MIAVIYSTIPLFWLLVHPFADSWRRQMPPFRILLPLWILLWIVPGIAAWPWHTMQLYSAPWSWIVAALFFLAGISVYRRIRTNPGAHILLGLAELRPQNHEKKLVTTGMYAPLRDPISFAHFSIAIA